MNFNELNVQWAEQRAKFRDWTLNLTRGALSVGKLLNQKLTPPAAWNDSNGHKAHEYINVLVKENKEYTPITLGNMEITPNGEGRFYISVTFDNGVDSYPKQQMVIAALIRYSNKIVQYDLWNHHNDAPSGDWTPDIDQFADRIIAGYAESLSHDPMIGYERPPMGFV